MTNILAQSGFSFLIFLVVGVFWLISQVAQNKRAKERAEEMRRRRLEREEEERRTGQKVTQSRQATIENELEEFLGRLTGQSTPPPAPPPPPPPPPPRKVTARKVPPIQFDQPPPPALDQIPEPPAEISSRSSIKELGFENAIQDIEELKEATDMMDALMNQDVRQEAMNNVHSMMIDLSDMNQSMPTIRMQNIRPVPTKTSRPDLKNKSQFRKALVTSFILEPPKALQPNPFEETE